MICKSTEATLGATNQLLLFLGMEPFYMNIGEIPGESASMRNVSDQVCPQKPTSNEQQEANFFPGWRQTRPPQL